VRLRKQDWPNVLALLIQETIIPSARARGLRGHIAVWNYSATNGGKYLVVITIDAEDVNARARGPRR
jgi:hypothetical protein